MTRMTGNQKIKKKTFVQVPQFVLLHSPNHRWCFRSTEPFVLSKASIYMGQNLTESEIDFIRLEIGIKSIEGTRVIRSVNVKPGSNEYAGLSMEVKQGDIISIERIEGNDRLDLGLAFTMKIEVR